MSDHGRQEWGETERWRLMFRRRGVGERGNKMLRDEQRRREEKKKQYKK